MASCWADHWRVRSKYTHKTTSDSKNRPKHLSIDIKNDLNNLQTKLPTPIRSIHKTLRSSRTSIVVQGKLVLSVDLYHFLWWKNVNRWRNLTISGSWNCWLLAAKCFSAKYFNSETPELAWLKLCFDSLGIDYHVSVASFTVNQSFCV